MARAQRRQGFKAAEGFGKAEPSLYKWKKSVKITEKKREFGKIIRLKHDICAK